jgi:hypothetical protein
MWVRLVVVKIKRSETYRNMCDPRPSNSSTFNGINAQIVQVNERGFEHKHEGNHCYEQEKDRNGE